MTRREFLRQAGVVVAGATAGAAALHPASSSGSVQARALASAAVAILVDPADPVANVGPARWALEQLREALVQRQIAVQTADRMADIPPASHCLLAAGDEHPLAREILARASVDLPSVPESLAMASGRTGGRSVLLACGHDPRGLTYALLELADRVRYADKPSEALRLSRPVSERPASPIRSIMRVFASEVEDKSWFYDRAFWQRYLSMLAAERFNRFSLALGLGYDFTSGIRDAYFHFAYPFLVAVPGYDVRVSGFSAAERERNLEMLRIISDETAARGLHFQLGLWTHAYKWTNSPQANHVIEGLTPQSHAPYCRDALRAVLTACPAIQGVTFRIHGESGVAEGSYAFWRTVFEGLTQCGRRVEIDMHAKGMDAEMIEVALATGLPVNISPKFWAEHLGLPYHQAGIRPTEMPPRGRQDEGFFAKSSGSRSFLRYGYGDLLAEGRRYGVLHRIWPGTQRLLLWGDTALAAGYGRAASFCGSMGVELFEPLSFKGRKGSGLPGGRDAYADASLKPAPEDFEKYAYGYRLWGRLLYNPDAAPETWRRQLDSQYGRAARPVEAALASASRILPLITTAHLPSAANNNYWPEIYTNMPIVDSTRKHPYGDTPSPKRFGSVSPLDPQLFSRIDDFAGELLEGNVSARYSPLGVADWLLALADTATRAMAKAVKLAADPKEPAFRRLAADVAIQIGLGRFFAEKLRAGVLFALHERTQDRRPLQEAASAYRRARVAWAQLGRQAASVYVPDITFGLDAHLRGHWQDRLPAIDQDIADMERRIELAANSASSPQTNDPGVLDKALRVALSKPERPAISAQHAPPRSFQHGRPLSLRLTFSPGSVHARSLSVRLVYRHANQAEEFRTAVMSAQAGAFEGVIPADYTDSPFPLQYYFEFRDGKGKAWMHPGLGPNLNEQPYYVVRRQRFSAEAHRPKAGGEMTGSSRAL